MINLNFEDENTSNHIMAELRRYEKTIAILDMIRDGARLPHHVLEAAPLLDPFCFVLSNTVLGGGRVRAGLGNGKRSSKSAPLFTNEVLIDARKQGWVGSRDGIYRIGTELSSSLEVSIYYAHR